IDAARASHFPMGLLRMSLASYRLRRSVGVDSTYSRTIQATAEQDTEAISLYELLEEMNWNISAVSKRMGCDRKTIYRHMKKAGISVKRLSQQWTENIN
ncbi:MAG: helix-turn-helix domain-containing protein, partial [bacterium]